MKIICGCGENIEKLSELFCHWKVWRKINLERAISSQLKAIIKLRFEI